MIALWMIYAVILTTLLAIAAVLLDAAARSVVAQRRWVWMLALGLSLGIPSWLALAPRAGLAGPPGAGAHVEGPARLNRRAATASQLALAELMSDAKQESLGRLDGLLAVAWAAMALVAVAAYAAATWSLARRRRAWRVTDVDGHQVLLAPATGPAVIGALHPAIVVPEWSLGLAADQRALMLEHERQHVRARDPLVLHAAAFVALLMPWNVAAWWLNRRLRLAVELDCDARVLAGGRDRRAYGTLLLDVCARHLSPTGVLLAPALFERTSSLTRRILAMNSDRPRFARTRLALGLTTALAIAALACDMPSPEALAPDGTNQVTKRLYGELPAKMQAKMQVMLDQRSVATQAMVAKYFPAVARGDGGPSILFLVRSATGDIVLAKAEPANELTRMREPEAEQIPSADAAAREQRLVREARERVALPAAPARPGMNLIKKRAGLAIAFTKLPTQGGWVPAGISAVRPDDIDSIDVSKHAAGTIAPNAVSLITITLKPGAVVPTTIDR
jgi:beta-lactamase regulating signal transducer with metallopeptidase domain